jgi:2-dehydro-3-deoxyphosphogluconate aldolase/(4S)-4-hydroxy-2-oxoglutarate aldolase
MMTRLEVAAKIVSVGILPAVRVTSVDDALFASYELSHAGIPIIEITVTDAGTLAAISELAKNKELIVGAGEVVHVEIARQCYNAGAMFITSPGFDKDVVDFAHLKDCPVFPGALTPTEVMAAWRAGSDFVKVFPCENVGGPRYIRALKAPFPDVPMIAAGGVHEETAGDFLRAGASALGIGGALVPRDSIQLRQSHRIRNLSKRFHGIIDATRKEMASVKADNQH